MSGDNSSEALSGIYEEIDDILSFAPNRDAVVIDDAFTEKAQSEGSGKYPVLVDSEGFTQGMRACCLNPFVKDVDILKQKVRQLKAKCERYSEGLNSYSEAEAELQKIDKRKDEEIVRIDNRYEGKEKYRVDKNEKDKFKKRYEEFRNKYGQREAVVMHPALNAGILISIGITEFFINYESILSAYGMPALSLGVAAIIAAVMAFVSHVHGTHLRQLHKRYGEHVALHEKRSNAGIFIFATMLLSVLLGYVGYTRYQHLSDLVLTLNMNTAAQWNIAAAVTIDVGSKVSMLTLSNMLVWALGVLVVYHTHDRDPEYMTVARKFHNAEKKYLKWQNEIEKEKSIKNAELQEEADDLNRTARSLEREYKPLRDRLSQVVAKIDGVNKTYQELIVSAIGAYYALFSRAAEEHNNLIILQEGKQINFTSYMPPICEGTELCKDRITFGMTENAQNA